MWTLPLNSFLVYKELFKQPTACIWPDPLATQQANGWLPGVMPLSWQAHQPALVEQSLAGSDTCHFLKQLGLIWNLWSVVSWKLGSDGSFKIRFRNPVASLTHIMRNFWDVLPPNFTHSLKIMRHAILQEIYLHRARRGNALALSWDFMEKRLSIHYQSLLILCRGKRWGPPLIVELLEKLAFLPTGKHIFRLWEEV